jgi:hypothetical protein
MGYDLAAPRLLLHSLMPAEAYETLRSTGTLRCDTSFSEQTFLPAYRWMYEEFARRRPAEAPGPLLWAWARIQRSALVDSLRHGGGEDVLVTLRVPRERVLLSDFDDWHAVLNHWELHPRALDDAEADRRIDAFWEERDALGVGTSGIETWPEPLRLRVMASWSQVFEIGPPPRAVQAVTCRFDAGDVVDAVEVVRPRRGQRPVQFGGRFSR